MSDAKGPMTDVEIYTIASEYEHEHGTDMFGFARALLREAGERLIEESIKEYVGSAPQRIVFVGDIRRILGVREAEEPEREFFHGKGDGEADRT